MKRTQRKGKKETQTTRVYQPQPVLAIEYPQEVQLLIACKMGREDLARKLVEADLVDASLDNNKALECCCENGRDKVAKYLLTRPGVTFDGNSALQLARKFEHDRCVALA